MATSNVTISNVTNFDVIYNITNNVRNITSNSTSGERMYLTSSQQIIITVSYFFGITGNLLALLFLCKKGVKLNNPKHRMMLKCLTLNDLVAMLGMLTMMYIRLWYISTVGHNHEGVWYCRFRVIWRVFGLGSGCVATVMAVERWLALTKPFLYQKHVTVELLKKCIFTMWACAIVLVCLPFFGFGVYVDLQKGKCVRYRMATEAQDVAYAYLYFAIGILLCCVIVYCNLAVMHALRNNAQQSVGHGKHKILMRRMSRSVSRMSTASTREELAFGRLMGFLCVIFLICWVPQLITIPLVQIMKDDKPRSGVLVYCIAADILMAMHFVFDPYVYVLQRWPVFRNIFSKKKQSSTRRCPPPPIRVPPYSLKSKQKPGEYSPCHLPILEGEQPL